MDIKHYDLLVIGAGSGFIVAKALNQAGQKVALVEKGPLGGTCLNRGCIPSKMLIYPSILAEKIRNAADINLDVTFNGIQWEKLVERVTHFVDSDAKQSEEAVKKWSGFDLYTKKGLFTADGTLEIEDHEITADNTLLALGAHPFIPDIPGLKETPYITSTEALRQKKCPKSLIIIGGGYIAAEMGALYSAAGAKVTIIVRSEMLRREDDTIRTVFIEEFGKRCEIINQTEVNQVQYHNKNFVVSTMSTDGQKKTFQAEALLVATGLEGDTANMGLENIGTQLDEKGFIQVDNNLRASTEKPIWAIGDCTGAPFFRHEANREANYVKDTLLDKTKKPFVRGTVPHAIYTSPTIGGVGLTEQQLKESNQPYLAATHEYTKIAQGWARGLKRGIFKLIADKEGKLLGAHACGEEATELIHLPMAFLSMEASVDDLLAMTIIHPTLHEVIGQAASSLKEKLEK